MVKGVCQQSAAYLYGCAGAFFHMYTAPLQHIFAPQAYSSYIVMTAGYIAMMAGSNLLLSSSERFFTRVLYVFTVCTE